ncbi:MAG: hypothetical protein HXY49_09490 [Ignavibacteriaceae bacterium]|nr:hypothetical protein [Ignavibacteriaceae bacterium]
MKYLFVNISICSLFAVMIFISGCKDVINDNPIDNIIIPDSNVSYSQHLAPVLERKCVPCHNSAYNEKDVDLSVWTNFVDGRIVVPGEPDNSLIVWSIEGRPPFQLMPPIGSPYAPFTTNQYNGLKKWIEEGAKNN